VILHPPGFAGPPVTGNGGKRLPEMAVPAAVLVPLFLLIPPWASGLNCRLRRVVYRVDGNQVATLLIADGRCDLKTLFERRLLSAIRRAVACARNVGRLATQLRETGLPIARARCEGSAGSQRFRTCSAALPAEPRVQASRRS